MGKYLEFKDENGWEYVSRLNCSGAVAILVYHKVRDEYLMVEQYRPAVKDRVLEFPAGLIDHGESATEAAIRELREEAGVVVSEDGLISLGQIYSGVGLTDEVIDLFAVEIDDETKLCETAPEIDEIDNGIRTLWVCEGKLYDCKEVKVLSILAKYKRAR